MAFHYVRSMNEQVERKREKRDFCSLQHESDCFSLKLVTLILVEFKYHFVKDGLNIHYAYVHFYLIHNQQRLMCDVMIRL